ncbi:MAG: sigma-70 family RNA polymerase sigma factor [Bacteroidetes bacterium]|nr:sigma-70 family RNA polymerase sigma factor [Bacteroidota bacterium]
MGLSEQLTETEIIRRILNGEKALYEIIVRRFNPYLYKVGRSYNYHHEDTQDLIQETFIDAYKHLSQFEGRSEFRTWLIRIMLNNCYRKKGKASFTSEIMQELNDQAQPLFTNADTDTEKMVQNRELGHIIENALGKMPYDYRMAFSLREISGLPVAETASLLQISEANVKVRVNRAKTMLRREIEKTYSASELFEFNLVYCDRIVAQVMQQIEAL